MVAAKEDMPIRNRRAETQGVTAVGDISLVPNTVPTPHIEALFSIASVAVPGWRKRLETSNLWEAGATIVPSANLLIS